MGIYISGFYLLFDFIINDIRPRYLEAVEESLNDTAHFLAAFLETGISNNRIMTDRLQKTFAKVTERSFRAKIYNVVKNRVALHVYVTNRQGIVIYDSKGKSTGKNFSKWNDVYLTLQGKYGARSSLARKGDESSSSLYVAAPIYHNNKIYGVVTAVKPKDSVNRFINLAREKLLIAGIFASLTLFLLSVLLSMLITRPVMKLIYYVKSLKKDEHARLPRLGNNEIRDLGLAFAEMKDELEGKQYIEHYIQTLTHELKSPLSTIKGAALLLQEDMPAEQRDTFYINIVNESERIEQIIQKMLQLASIEGRKELKDIETIDIKELISGILESFAPQITKYTINIKNKLTDTLTVKGERFLLRHALANLIQNAINFTNSCIHIYSEIKDKHIVLYIKDDGEGVPEYAINKIFDKFYSLPGKVTNRKSTGLGLPFVKEVALLHHGSVAVINNTENGSTAIFTIPQKNI